MQTLEDIKPGYEVNVVKLKGQGVLRRHIMDMGITKGVRIFVRRVAPLGDPIEIMVRGYELSIRKEEAKNILVKQIER